MFLLIERFAEIGWIRNGPSDGWSDIQRRGQAANIFENLVFNLQYQRLRYKNSINDSYKGILYYLLLTMRIKSVWILPSYGKVDDEYKTNQYGFRILKSFKDKILLTVGINGYLNDGKDIIIPYISLRYNIWKKLAY